MLEVIDWVNERHAAWNVGYSQPKLRNREFFVNIHFWTEKTGWTTLLNRTAIDLSSNYLTGLTSKTKIQTHSSFIFFTWFHSLQPAVVMKGAIFYHPNDVSNDKCSLIVFEEKLYNFYLVALKHILKSWSMNIHHI